MIIKLKTLFVIVLILGLMGGAGLGYAYYKHEQEENKAVVPASDLVMPEESTSTDAPAPKTVPAKKPGTYTVAEVQTASTSQKCWTVIRGKVYNLTSYLNVHPGGKDNIIQVCGKDGTATFDSQHKGEGKAEDKLTELYLGTLVK